MSVLLEEQVKNIYSNIPTVEAGLQRATLVANAFYLINIIYLKCIMNNSYQFCPA